MTRSISLGVAGVLLAGLYWASRYNYLLFHCLAEGFSIVIACGIFMMGWNTRRFMDNRYLVILGIAYLCVAGLDVLHTLTYRGMGVLPGYGANEPTQLWIAARSLESVSLLLAGVLIHRKINAHIVFWGYALVTSTLILSIFAWNVFPDCYVEGQGLTPFKRISEYVICLTLLCAVVPLVRSRNAFEKEVTGWLAGAVLLTILSELVFTLYIQVTDTLNLIGHYLKIISMYCVYRAIIQTGLTRPYSLLFHDLKESEQQYRKLFTHMINGAAHQKINVDAQGNPVDYTFLEVNDAFARMSGLTREELIGKRVTEIAPDVRSESVDRISIYGKVALTGESTRFETFSAQLQKWFSVHAYCPEPGYIVSILEDITERKRAEAALEGARADLMRANEELERKVHQRTIKLQESIADLEQFSYSIAHDMRAPLRSMNAFSSLLLADCAGKLDPEHVDYLQRIAAAAQRLDGLIKDVLNYSKIARESVTLEPVNLDQLVPQIVQGYPCFHLENARIEIAHPLHPVCGNTALVTLCISNLLTNAIKFVAPQVKPQIRIWTENHNPETVRVLVQDNGIGIDSVHLDRIWRIFERLHHSNEYPGTGIGLSIVKRAVERMRGRAGVESSPGRGSTFWFELPKRDQPA